MIGDDDLYLDRIQLAARGWTRTLTERHLPSTRLSVIGGHNQATQRAFV